MEIAEILNLFADGIDPTTGEVTLILVTSRIRIEVNVLFLPAAGLCLRASFC